MDSEIRLKPRYIPSKFANGFLEVRGDFHLSPTRLVGLRLTRYILDMAIVDSRCQEYIVRAGSACSTGILTTAVVMTLRVSQGREVLREKSIVVGTMPQ